MSSIIRRRAAQSNQKINKSISGSGVTAVLPTHNNITSSRKGTSGAFGSTVALVIFVCLATSFILLLCLKGGSGNIDGGIEHSKVVEEEHLELNSSTRSPSLIKILASDHANLTQFFPCVNDVFMYVELILCNIFYCGYFIVLFYSST